MVNTFSIVHLTSQSILNDYFISPMNSVIKMSLPYQSKNFQYSGIPPQQNTMTINPNLLISPKLIKSSLEISSANIPQNMKYIMIKSLIYKNTTVESIQKSIPQSNIELNNSNNQNIRSSSNTRIPFKKEEDEKIKDLVKIFGNRRWNLIAQFMEGRTAKQCRDRYSNYLMPGFFQGEWSKEEDSLLIKLFNEHGPRWSIIQKSFQNRSSNNIKNRWYYFLHKNIKKTDEKERFNEDKSENLKIESKNEETYNNEVNQFHNNDFDNQIISDDVTFFEQQNDIYCSVNNLETDNEWILFN